MLGARRAFISTLILVGFFGPVAAEAQEAAKVARIGYLGTNLAVGRHMQEAFLQGLRDLGYVEGRNLGSRAATTSFATRTAAQLLYPSTRVRPSALASCQQSSATARSNGMNSSLCCSANSFLASNFRLQPTAARFARCGG